MESEKKFTPTLGGVILQSAACAERSEVSGESREVMTNTQITNDKQVPIINYSNDAKLKWRITNAQITKQF